MRLYGLTGGTGSGKSAAARRFAERGVPVIDADRAGHEVIAPGGAASGAVVEAFGETITTHGIIDREKLGALVFRDPDALDRLNRIVHPAIFAEIGRQCARLAESGHDRVILDAALLGENGVRDPWLAGLILVSADRSLRRDRLVTQRGMQADDVDRRMALQRDPEEKRAIADWIIENNGTLEALYRQVDAIVEALDAQRA